jgi:hypothetical protein
MFQDYGSFELSSLSALSDFLQKYFTCPRNWKHTADGKGEKARIVMLLPYGMDSGTGGIYQNT